MKVPTKVPTLSKAAFLEMIAKRGTPILVAHPASCVVCVCGDVNCYGWRFVPRRRP